MTWVYSCVVSTLHLGILHGTSPSIPHCLYSGLCGLLGVLSLFVGAFTLLFVFIVLGSFPNKFVITIMLLKSQ